MWLFIAGAITSGAVQASAALVSRLSAWPPASLAIVFADAGAIRKASQRDDQLEVGDRVVVGRGVAREGAAGGVGLELVHQHRGAGDPLERRPSDEIEAGGRLHHPHRVARLGGQPHQLDGLVGRDATGDAEQQAGHG